MSRRLGRVMAAAMRDLAIDTHAHVFRRDLALAHDRRYAPAYDATIADYLAMLDCNRMSHGVLVQPSFLGTDNSYLLQALRQAPARLRGIAVVAPDAAPDGLAALDQAGIVGLRLNLLGRPSPPPHDPVQDRRLAHVAALGWQVELHAEACRLPTLLPPLLEAGVPIVVDHFGRPDPRLGVADPGFRYLLRAGETGRVWVKLSAAYRNARSAAAASHAPALAAALHGALGPSRLLWGSDWPHTQFERCDGPAAARAALDAWVPDPAQRRTILADTPSCLFGFARA